MAFRETRASDMAHKIRQCPFCGLQVLRTATQCPSCREALPGAEGSAQHAPVRASQPRQRSLVRRGLLYMLLAAVIQYFSGGYSAMHIPVVVDFREHTRTILRDADTRQPGQAKLTDRIKELRRPAWLRPFKPTLNKKFSVSARRSARQNKYKTATSFERAESVVESRNRL